MTKTIEPKGNPRENPEGYPWVGRKCYVQKAGAQHLFVVASNYYANTVATASGGRIQPVSTIP